jgi:hypothetical protein
MGGDELAAEAAALKQKIRDARKDVCDTQLINETASIETIKLALRVRKTLRGHLSKVCEWWSNPSSVVCNFPYSSRFCNGATGYFTSSKQVVLLITELFSVVPNTQIAGDGQLQC